MVVTQTWLTRRLVLFQRGPWYEEQSGKPLKVGWPEWRYEMPMYSCQIYHRMFLRMYYSDKTEIGAFIPAIAKIHRSGGRSVNEWYSPDSYMLPWSTFMPK
jgi:hypothetical protein